MNINGQLEYKLRQLRLTGILQTLPVRVKQAEESKAGYEEFLMMLLEDEYERRQSGRLLKRLKQAGFEEEKTIEGFDFGFNPQIPVKRIKALANCAYIDKRENIFLLGPVGVGKTHIAQALGHIACRMCMMCYSQKQPACSVIFMEAGLTRVMNVESNSIPL